MRQEIDINSSCHKKKRFFRSQITFQGFSFKFCNKATTDRLLPLSNTFVVSSFNLHQKVICQNELKLIRLFHHKKDHFLDFGKFYIDGQNLLIDISSKDSYQLQRQ